MFRMTERIEGYDEQLWAAMLNERQRQEDHIELIASENYTSPRVLEAQGSVLTNKYAEGYPGKRYYGGCEYVDVAEQLAIDRAKELFGAAYVNVQPHSGSSANAAVYMALAEPGDTILGMSLAHGGHLTHGAAVNFSGKLYNAVQYGLNDENGEIDYDQVESLAKKNEPRLIMAGFSAYSRIVDWARFREIADSVGAYLVVDMAHVAGLVAVGLYPSPVSIADVTTTTTHKTLRGARGGMILARANEAIEKNAQAMADSFIERGYKIVSGGTDNHLFLVDLIGKDITGKDADAALGRAYITVNKNSVPNDPRSPFVTSGIRIGTPASTTRGFSEIEMRQVADWISDILDHMGDESVVDNVRTQVLDLCSRFPVYADK